MFTVSLKLRGTGVRSCGLGRWASWVSVSLGPTAFFGHADATDMIGNMGLYVHRNH